jgi:uncharacterized protein
MAGQDDDDGRRLSIVWSQEELFKRTWAQRIVARYWRLALAFAVLVVVAIAVWAVGGALLAEGALRPARHRLDRQAIERASAIAARGGATLRDVSLMATDGAMLRGWWFARDGASRGTVVLLHGISTNRSAMLGFAELLVGEGYRVLAVDLRAHGESGGRAVTYGVLERRDLRAWVSWVRGRHPDECVFGVGASLGGAVLLQTLGTEDFCAAVAEAPFATFHDVALFRLERGVPLPASVRRLVLTPFVHAGVAYARLRYGISLDDADARPALARTRVPVLIVHGTNDASIPPGDAERLAAENPAHVTVWRIDGARHVQSWSAAPEAFPRRVLTFLAAHQ